ncbi:MAG: hypothetical protein AB7E77_03000 [Desulfobulbus sp.]
MTKILTMMIVGLGLMAGTALAGVAAPDWKEWDAYPNVQRMTAEQIQELLVAGEKMVFIYAGYKTDKIVCGSMYLPYTAVPPNASGSAVNIRFPKDTWMVAYCP